MVRSLRITNEKKDPPRAADAKFDKPAAAKAAGEAAPFGGGFVLPGDEPAKAAAAPDAEPAAKAADYQPDSRPGSWK